MAVYNVGRIGPDRWALLGEALGSGFNQGMQRGIEERERREKMEALKTALGAFDQQIQQDISLYNETKDPVHLERAHNRMPNIPVWAADDMQSYMLLLNYAEKLKQGRMVNKVPVIDTEGTITWEPAYLVNAGGLAPGKRPIDVAEAQVKLKLDELQGPYVKAKTKEAEANARRLDRDVASGGFGEGGTSENERNAARVLIARGLPPTADNQLRAIGEVASYNAERARRAKRLEELQTKAAETPEVDVYQNQVEAAREGLRVFEETWRGTDPNTNFDTAKAGRIATEAELNILKQRRKGQDEATRGAPGERKSVAKATAGITPEGQATLGILDSAKKKITEMLDYFNQSPEAIARKEQQAAEMRAAEPVLIGKIGDQSITVPRRATSSTQELIRSLNAQYPHLTKDQLVQLAQGYIDKQLRAGGL